MLISVHIPKTGGTTFQDILERLYQGRIYLDYAERILVPGLWRKRLRLALGLNRVHVPQGTLCIHGHFLANKYDRLYRDAPVVTWVRDPVDRIVSQYHYTFRCPDMEHPIFRRLVRNKPTLEEFVRIRQLRNVQSTYINGKKLEKFRFIGVTEEYEKSIELFAKIFDIEEPLAVPAANVNKERQDDGYVLDPETRTLIERCNSLDIELYAEARRRFAAACRAYGIA